MTHVFALNIPSIISKPTIEHLLTKIDESQQTQLSRFHFAIDMQRSLLGCLLTKMQISRLNRVPPEEIQIERPHSGKPFCNWPHQCYFNVSHSGQWIVCAISNLNVGIDIEKIVVADLEIANQFFSQNEIQLLDSKPEHERDSFFFLLWTLKESWLKYTGEGLSLPLNDFSFSITGSDLPQLYRQDQIDNSIVFRNYNLDPNYHLSLCSESKEVCSNVSIIPLESLIEFFI